MKRRISTIILFILTMILLTSCQGDREIERLSILGGLKTEYTVGDIPDYSTLSLVAVYNDGTSKNLSYSDVSISNLDTSVIGEQALNIRYDGYTLTVTINIKGKKYDPPTNGTPTDPDQTILTATSLPDSLAMWETNRKDFIDRNQAYVVGDDNEFFFTLKLSVYNTNGEKVNVSSYTSVSNVYLFGSETPLEGEELNTYVSIDEERNAFDFSEEAVGKTFTISTRPRDVLEGTESEMSKSITVTVVDGYNIYKAFELNYITTNDETLPVQSLIDNTRTRLQIIDDFLRLEKNATRPEQISSIVIHNNLSVKTTDIPSEYFVNMDRSGELIDDIAIFYHYFTETDTAFTIHGNYFAIYTHELPCVENEQSGTYGDMGSSTKVFKFDVKDAIGIDYDHTKYVSTVNNLMMVGNDPASDNLDKVDQSMRGLIAIETRSHTININNSKIQNYYITIVSHNDYHTVNINQCILYGSFQQHFYLVSNNSAQQSDDDEPLAVGYPRLTLNIKSSDISGSGGPAIVTQTDGPSKVKNKFGGVLVNISDDTHIESWFSGEEAFFKYIGIGTLLVEQVKGIDRLLLKYNSSILKEEIRNVDGKPTKFKLMNVIMLNILLPDLDNGYDGIVNDLMGKTDIDGKLVIGGKTIMDMDDYVIDGKNSNFANPTISDLKAQNVQNNVLTTPDGDVAYTAPGETLRVVSGDITANGDDDYLIAYYYSLGIVFANYHTI